MVRQHQVAIRNDFTFLRTARQVRDFAASDRLEDVTNTENYLVTDVSFPYARPVVKLFIERLAEQYRRATGDPLVVTSLTRPTSLQPRNASPLSVHPAGMAVDFRVPSDPSERTWLERTLLALEDRGVLDVTRERHPAHYHVAVFPDAYASYVAGIAVAAQQLTAAVPTPASPKAVTQPVMEAIAEPVGDSMDLTPLLAAALGVSCVLLVGLRARSRRGHPAGARQALR